MTNAKTYTLGKLAELLDAELIGDPDSLIDGLATLKDARAGKLSFLSNPAYTNQLEHCQASAVILSAKFIDACSNDKLVSNSPYVSYAKASQLFDARPIASSGVHESAVIHDTAVIGNDVSIGAHAVIDAAVIIGSGSVIGAACVLNEGVSLGKNCRLQANVTLYHRVVLGNEVVIHSGAILGADGFGFAFDGEQSVKIAQLGRVVIEDQVEIGAGTTIDRGALGDTVIEQGVKIDNQVQIGHNCRIGAHSVICGCTAIAGSATIGKYCVLGGASGVVGHISIADGVKVSAMSLVSQTITEKGIYSSGTGLMPTPSWKKNIVRFRQLDKLSKRVNELEKKLSNTNK